MQTMTDHPNDIGIGIMKSQRAYPTCACSNGHNLEYNHEILENRKNLHNLSEAMRIDSVFTGDMKAQNYNTTAMLFSLFDVMFHW